MSLFKKQQKRKRPSLDYAKKRPSSYNDYYKSESKRASTNSNPKATVSGGSVRRIHVSGQARHIPTYVSVVLIVFSLIYSSIISNNVLVIVPKDQGLFDRPYYESVALKVMQQSVFNKTKFTFDARKFKEDFTKEIPEIKDINLSVPLAGKKPVAGVTFFKPLYIFSVSNKDYIVGENGVILANSQDVSSDKKELLRRITDDAPLEVSVGKPVLLASDIVFIESMYKQLETANVTITSARLPLGAGELYVQPGDKKYLIKFALAGDAAQQVGAYLSVIKNLDTNNLPQEYVDVRLAERVFVK